MPTVGSPGSRILLQGEQFGVLNVTDVTVRVGPTATCTQVQLEEEGTISCLLGAGTGDLHTLRVCNRFGCGSASAFSIHRGMFVCVCVCVYVCVCAMCISFARACVGVCECVVRLTIFFFRRV